MAPSALEIQERNRRPFALGADIRCMGEEGFFPLEIKARGLAGGTVSIDASASSQLLSALLMVAPLARNPIEVSLASGVRWTLSCMGDRAGFTKM